jgi:protein-disulfide isomerase
MPARRFAVAAVLLCAFGVAVSIELTRIHVFVHTDPEYHSVCAMSEGVNCETVAVSPYSVFAGLPVSVWGIAGYALMGALGLWAASRRRLHPSWPWGLLILLAIFSAGASAVLAFVSATRIDSLCLFCMGTYAINAALLALCIVALSKARLRLGTALAGDLRALFARPVLAAALIAAGAATLVALEAFVPTYWKTPGWDDLPPLASGTDGDGHHWIGARDPELTIVEFSDYECPHCRAAHKDVRLLAADQPDRIRLVHRHFPLDRACNPSLKRPFHERACELAEAAECAALQGRFWEMNDALFSIQDTVKTKDVDPVDIAVRLGLDRSELARCLERHETADRIEGDLRAARDRKLRGTPSFVIGEKAFMGRIPKRELERPLRGAP